MPATLKFRCHIAAIRDRRHWVAICRSIAALPQFSK
jgi:hypothetical protein